MAEVDTQFDRLLVLPEAHGETEPKARRALRKAEALLAELFHIQISAPPTPHGLEAWRRTFRYKSAAETWRVHGDWIDTANPVFAPPIAQRFAWAKSVTPEQYAEAAAARQTIVTRLQAIMGRNTFLCLPSTPGIAPRLDSTDDDIESFRQRTQRLTCIASLAGLPQVSIPAAIVDGCPLGLSVIGPQNSDLHLLNLCIRFAALAGEPRPPSRER